MSDITDAPIKLKPKTLATIIIFVVSVVAAAVFGYFRLDAKADAGVEAKGTLKAIQCDIRQLKNYMLYSIKPDPRDRCDQ